MDTAGRWQTLSCSVGVQLACVVTPGRIQETEVKTWSERKIIKDCASGLLFISYICKK